MLEEMLILPLENPFTVVFLFLTLVAAMNGLPWWIAVPMLPMAYWSSGVAGVGWVLALFVVGRAVIHILSSRRAPQIGELP